MAAVISPQRLYNIAKLNRNAAYKLKNGSPKFKDVFRARCRAKVKENRDKILNKLRNLCTEVDVEVLSALGVFEPDESLLRWNPESDDELTEEEEQIISEYEALLSSEEEMFSEMLQKSLEEVVCPVCEKTPLTIEEDETIRTVCQRCGFRIPTKTSLQDTGKHIQSCVNEHNSVCGSTAQFHMVPEDDSMHIYMLCSQCSYMNIIL